MSKKILVILGHPDRDSFCGSLAQAYIEGAKASNVDIKEIYLGELNFDPILWHGYKVIQELEEDLKRAQENIKWAEHIVFVYPTWWYTFPALLKGFMDRTILPGFGFHFHGNSFKYDKLLTDRSAHLITTMDAPPIYYKWIKRSPGHKMMKSTLKICGIKPIRTTEIGSVKRSSEEKRKKWLKMIKRKGEKLL